MDPGLLCGLSGVRELKHSFTPLAYEVEDGSLSPSKTLKMENFTILENMFRCQLNSNTNKPQLSLRFFFILVI